MKTCRYRAFRIASNWLTLKLIGKKTNRAAIGIRIKGVATGKNR